MKITVNKWSEFQHYKDRKPPWIKLHRTLLDDRGWHGMSDMACRLLIELWLLASENDPEHGHIEMDSDAIAWRLRYDGAKAKNIDKSLQELAEYGFVTVCSDTLADSLQCATTETETETEAKKEKERKKSPPEVPMSLALELAESILSWKPDLAELVSSKREKTIERWATDIDRMMRIDMRSQSTTSDIIAWLPSHEGRDSFRWRDQILSGKKLREKFDKLQIAMDICSPNSSDDDGPNYDLSDLRGPQ